jgi:chromosomal replication initiator protein
MHRSPAVWDGVLRRLHTEMPALALDAWIRPLSVREEADRIVLCAPNPFHRERVRSRFLSLIHACARAEAGGAVQIELTDTGGCAKPNGPKRAVACAPAVEASAAPAALACSAQASDGARQLELPHTFETFVVGSANALAREASLALARDQQRAASPLYLAGPPGSGKSHLARAVASEARHQRTGPVVYVSAEAFTGQLTGAIRAHATSAFRKRYRDECRLLILEDVQFLQGKPATQLELFHTVEHLRLVGGRVVLTADRLPREMKRFEERLASQLTGGLVAEIDLPGSALRRDILRAKAARGGVRIPDDCLALLAERARGSLRDLEGVLIQLVSSAALLKRPIDRELTEAALRKLRCDGPAPLTIDQVAETVCGFFGVSRAQLSARSQARGVALPRQLAMYLCRRYTDASLSEIGRAFGRNHPSVANALGNVERAILERAPLRYQVEELAARLDAQPR